MPQYVVTGVKLRLEYMVKAVDHEPHEEARELTISEFAPTDQSEIAQASGQPILGLRVAGTKTIPRYVLYRLQDDPDTIFDFDTSPDEPLHAAFKLNLTLTDQGTNNTREITSNYPILPEDDNLRAKWPKIMKWKFLLTREDAAPPQYRLFHNVPGGGGSAPECEQLQCDTTEDPANLRECALKGCYDVAIL